MREIAVGSWRYEYRPVRPVSEGLMGWARCFDDHVIPCTDAEDCFLDEVWRLKLDRDAWKAKADELQKALYQARQM